MERIPATAAVARAHWCVQTALISDGNVWNKMNLEENTKPDTKKAPET